MNCEHLYINIIPTLETAWGLEERFNVVCNICGYLLFKAISSDEILSLCNKKNYTIVNGNKYV